ncbi:MAG TPA: hypothetical protein DEA91_10010, partial [Paenibacillus sp.]|nr:hypothetical protein [Paenibacillus sp.]
QFGYGVYRYRLKERLDTGFALYKKWFDVIADTPAPTPTLDDTKFLKTINEVWGFIKGDGSFTGPQLKEWSKGLDADLCRQILRV